MNYLAHSFLSNGKEELIIGNFIADHLRGNNFSEYSPGIIEGIKLHRRIDEYTDSHPLFKESKRIFYEGFEKHSGILVDIYFDHLLASDFSSYSNQTLKEHCDDVYEVYRSNLNLLPLDSQRFLSYVLQNNIYMAYGEEKGIEKVLFHLSRRIKHGVQLNDSLSVFQADREKLKNNFSMFFHDAKQKFILEK
jgi:acyl carrier protein phosphodiesterase